MRNRKLGIWGLTVSELGLGCMGMTYAYGGRDDTESRRTIEQALEQGVTLFDTADMYGPWTNEELLGPILGPHRDTIVLATKFGIEVGPDGQLTERVNGRPDYLRHALDGSLRRLGVDHIDLYYQHRVDPDVPIEETWGAMAELVAAGKVNYLGISEAAPETIRRAHAVHPVTAVQSEYSLFTRDIETDGVLDVLRELGIGLVAYSPLGRGVLSGTIRSGTDLASNDRRRRMPRFQEENLENNLDTVGRLGALAEANHLTPAQLALAWVLAQGGDIVAIPGTKRRSYLDDNLAAAEVTLSADDLAVIDQVAPVGVAAGPRYDAGPMRRVRG